jgi:hypothetical protein
MASAFASASSARDSEAGAMAIALAPASAVHCPSDAVPELPPVAPHVPVSAAMAAPRHTSSSSSGAARRSMAAFALGTVSAE